MGQDGQVLIQAGAQTGAVEESSRSGESLPLTLVRDPPSTQLSVTIAEIGGRPSGPSQHLCSSSSVRGGPVGEQKPQRPGHETLPVPSRGPSEWVAHPTSGHGPRKARDRSPWSRAAGSGWASSKSHSGRNGGRLWGGTCESRWARDPDQPRPVGDGTMRNHAGEGPEHPIYFVNLGNVSEWCRDGDARSLREVR